MTVLQSSLEGSGTLPPDPLASARVVRARARSPWTALGLLLPAAALVAVFFVFPLVRVVFDSVNQPTQGLANYEWVFSQDVNLEVLRRTIVTAVGVTVAAVLVAYPYAYLMTHVGSRLRNVLYLVVLIPLWTSLMVRTIAWIVLLQDDGPINRGLQLLGFAPVQLLLTSKGVTIAMIQVLMPFVVLPMYSSMAKIDKRLVPAAVGLGARPSVAFYRVFLPQSLPGVLAGALTVFIFSLGFYIIPALIGSPKNALVSSAISRQVALFQPGRGAALAVLLLVVTFAFLLLVLGARKLVARRGVRR